MSRLMGRTRPVEVGIWTVLLAGWFALATRFPPSGDDWTWGGAIGLDRLHHGFVDYNGRYAGNLFVLLLTRSAFLDTLVTALVLVTITALVVRIAGARGPLAYAGATAGLLVMPVDVLRQGVVWTSGMTNYSMGGLALLVFLASARRTLLEPDRPWSWWRTAFVVLGGAIGQLFIEHVTLYVLGASVLVALVGRVWRGRWLAPALAWVAGALLGAVVMFSNGAYRRAASGTSEYQQIGAQGTDAVSAPTIFHDVIAPSGLVGNVWLNRAVLLTLGLLAIVTMIRPAARAARSGARVARSGTRVARSGARGGGPPPRLAVRRVLALLVLLASVGIGAALSGATDAVQALALIEATPQDLPPQTAWVAGLVLVIPLLGALLTRGADRWVLLLVSPSVLILIGPLLFVRPVGPRNFLPTYLLFLIGGIVVLRVLGERIGRVGSAVACGGLAVVALVHGVQLYSLYDDVVRAEDARLATIRAAVAAGKTSVTVPELPHRGWVHFPDPHGVKGNWVDKYADYYGLPKGLRIHLTAPVDQGVSR